MAFFSAVSSTIGKKLLLFGLRHIDILDKDPADFVSVDVGKKTTLEVRDVGLHIKKLVALLHLKLPPEIRLSEARASLFRVTFVLEFGVPQIIIEIDGIQVQAQLVGDSSDPHSKSRGTERSQPRTRSPLRCRPSSPPPPADDSSDVSSDDEDDHIPTVDDLAQSFIREEPEAEIKELEHELESRSAYLQESVSSSESDDESVAGMGAPLALPTYLRNILNTALDRLKIVINNIDIEIQDQLLMDTISSNSSQEADGLYTSLNFHIDRVAIDSVTAEEPRVHVKASTAPADTSSKLGKRRLRVENICARVISDADNFAPVSSTSRASSPAVTRSGLSLSRNAQSEPSSSHSFSEQHPSTQLRESPPLTESSTSASPSSQGEVGGYHDQSPPSQQRDTLASSVNTTDEDRFADVGSDDDLDRSVMKESQGSIPIRDMSASSILYDDEGVMEYAMDNDLLDSQIEGHDDHQPSQNAASAWSIDGTNLRHYDRHSPLVSEASASGLLSASALDRLSTSAQSEQPPRSLTTSERSIAPVDKKDHAIHVVEEGIVEAPSSGESPHVGSSQNEDLSESKFFSHDEAESMYMSAMSEAPLSTSRRRNVPGGWDSSSDASSQDTGSDTSAPIPESMIAGSILGPIEVEDGCETPRPSSPQSAFSSPIATRKPNTEETKSSIMRKSQPSSRLAKRFLTIDEITVWFPLGLSEDKSQTTVDESDLEESGFDFKPPNLGQDSIFQGMPGSFSNYAHSSRGKPEENARRRPDLKSPQAQSIPQPKKKPSTAISVEVGAVIGHMDTSTGQIMYQMLTKALAVLTGEGTSESEKDTSQLQEASTGQEKRSNVELSVKDITLAFCEQLVTESVVGAYDSRGSFEMNPLKAILKINLSSTQVASQVLIRESRAKIRIGKFALSSLDHDIIAFQNSRPKSRKSIGSSDVEIDYEQAKERRVTIVTRPVMVMFDLQKLDEALSSFGGFSGVLELSSSFSSPNNSPVPFPEVPKPRGVHFKDTAPVIPPSQPDDVLKMDVQFGEVDFTLKGKSCAMQLHTTSVRLALRDGNVRLKVTEVQLSGPYTDPSLVGAPLTIKIDNSTVNFLSVPKEEDLGRLLAMITPSKDKYENDDDILVDTLLRQRRKGSVLRVEVASVGVRLADPSQMQAFEALGEEVAMLSKVTKYLPDDDRPGILTLATVHDINVSVTVNKRIGDVSVALQNASIAHVGVPALFAAEIGGATVRRGEELLVHEVVALRGGDAIPMIMVRFVGDEMEPIVKAKLYNLCVEYHVSTIMAALDISEDGTLDEIALGLASSVATITGVSSSKALSRESSVSTSPAGSANKKPLHVDVLFRHCALGLNPRKIPAKCLFVLTDAHLLGKQSKEKDSAIELEFRKASIHAIDNVIRLDEKREGPLQLPRSSLSNLQLSELLELGYVSMSTISAAKVSVSITGDGKDQPQLVDVEFKNELLILESCADSTQTLIAILNGLQPPKPPSTAEKYRTVVPLQEMMKSFTGAAIDAQDNSEDEDFMENADLVADEVPTNLEFVGSFYNQGSLPTEEELGDSMLGEDDLGVLAPAPVTRQRGERNILESFQEQYEVAEDENEFDFDEGYFKDSGSEDKGKARKWDSNKNQYHLTNEFKIPNAPLKVRVRDMNIIWNLFDGYDWSNTRDAISQAVDDVEARAEERRRKAQEEDDDDDFVEEDFLFNSVWIGVPIKDEKGALARRINHDIDDLVSETGSHAPSTATRSSNATIRPHSMTKPTKSRLKLQRSKRKKIAIQVMGVSVDFLVFPPDSGETLSSVDVRVHDFEIFDHVPGSVWNKFVTCTIERQQREINRPMINLELLTVKPTEDLAASDLVIRVSVLPLRLHVDQLALEFITRFFEFKDSSALESSTPAEQPFIQRLEVNAVQLKLDYKPRHVDYRGLRSGHTTEMMNFLMLEGSNITLRHAIVYGVSSFDKLHKTLNDVWMPDVQRNQLPGVLAGLAVVRPLVNVGSGVRDLIVVPMREYKKDGRIVRSLQKGVYAFATNTTAEFARLGAKVAIGAQNILEGTEKILGADSSSPGRASSLHHDWEGEDPSSSDSEEPRAVSNYAHQPIGVRAGLRSAARHLERDLLTARDAVIAIPGEIMEEGSGVGAAKAVARRAPTILLRPALGATKAVSNALLGVGNALDPQSRRNIDDVSIFSFLSFTWVAETNKCVEIQVILDD
jgi:autophagy-related protein 2